MLHIVPCWHRLVVRAKSVGMLYIGHIPVHANIMPQRSHMLVLLLIRVRYSSVTGTEGMTMNAARGLTASMDVVCIYCTEVRVGFQWADP